jgi:hypothetical protein
MCGGYGCCRRASCRGLAGLWASALPPVVPLRFFHGRDCGGGAMNMLCVVACGCVCRRVGCGVCGGCHVVFSVK